MSWVTVIWSMAAGVALALAALQLLVWLRDRAAIAHLVFSVAAVAAAVIAGQELALMHARTPAEYAEILRWWHVSAAAIVIAIVWFVRFYLGTGRLWLAWLITLLRGLILLANFLVYPNATFAEIHRLREVSWLGESLTAPVGDQTPWRNLIHLSMLLLVVYVLDAANTARKQGKHRPALTLAAGILLAVALAAVTSDLMVRGVLPGPLVALVFLVIVAAMAVELSVDLVRARQLARELHESRERMRLAAQAADLGLWEWDVVEDRIWANEVIDARVGISGTKPMGLKDYLALVHPEDRERMEAAIRRTITEGVELNEEYRLTGLNASEHWIDARGRVEYDDRRQPLRLRGVSADITARKRLEDEAQRHRNQLARAQRVLALGQLSSVVAHELNQPIGAILRNAEAGENFLRRDPPDLDEVREILADIRKDDQRAAAVIGRMRSLLQSGPLRTEAIAPRELAEQAAATLETEIRARDAALSIAAPAELPKVRGDRIHLQQVLINLLLNSVDASSNAPERQRHIALQATRSDNDKVVFSVEDNGEGFEPDRLSDLFVPYYTTKADGIGLGLSISKTIVEAHGGSIHAENTASGGARVWFSLPVAEEEIAA
ncbi:MAG TPA: hypothetical protein DDY14_01985 [Chromatiaceae bacterium]|jgi:two-component system sensor kinase FixL|nr:MAG: PAS domain-containing protein [Thiohalocapsa sp. PB-PSB1]HBG94102.1 hypothetical protein [Chromatiaceae bacterium]